MEIISLLSTGNWVFAHKNLIKKYNSDVAILVGYLADQQSQFGEWFYCSYEKIEKSIGLKKFTIRQSFKLMEKEGLVKRKLCGMPSKPVYKLSSKKLLSIFNNNQTQENPEVKKTKPLELKKTKPLEVKKTKPHTYIKNILSKEYPIKKINKKFKRTKPPLENFKSIYDQYDFFRDEFKEIWINEFIPLKTRKKASTTPESFIRQLNKIKRYSNGNYEDAVEILSNSVDGGWSGFYDLDKNKKKSYQKPKINEIGGTHYDPENLPEFEVIKMELPFIKSKNNGKY